MTMNGATRTARQQLSPPPSPSEDLHNNMGGGETSNILLSNPSYDIITGDVSQFATQYYHTVEPSENAMSSPKDGDGSSSDSSSSGRSKISSTSSDEGSQQQSHRKKEQNLSPSLIESVPRTLPMSSGSSVDTHDYTATPSSQQQQQKVAMAMCSSSGGSGVPEGTSVKHWSYEEQFKQVK